MQDLQTIRTQPQVVPPVAFNYTSRVGFIRNVATNRNLKPRVVTNTNCLQGNWRLVMGDQTNNEFNKVRWIQTEGHVG